MGVVEPEVVRWHPRPGTARQLNPGAGPDHTARLNARATSGIPLEFWFGYDLLALRVMMR